MYFPINFSASTYVVFIAHQFCGDDRNPLCIIKQMVNDMHSNVQNRNIHTKTLNMIFTMLFELTYHRRKCLSWSAPFRKASEISPQMKQNGVPPCLPQTLKSEKIVGYERNFGRKCPRTHHFMNTILKA